MRKAFTFAETLLVVLILGLLAGVGVVKLHTVFTDGVADRARADIELLNKAVQDWRADNPSLDFAAAAGGSATTAWALVAPFLPLPSGVVTLADFNRNTRNHWIYAYRGTYAEGVTAAAIRTAGGNAQSQPLQAGWPSVPATVCLLGNTPTQYVFYAVAAQP